VRAYRFAVHAFIPRVAYALTLLRRDHEPPDTESPDLDTIRNEVATVAAQDNWDHWRRKAGIGTYTLAGILFVIPKIGPLSIVAIKGPTSATEAEYLHSVVQSTDTLRRAIARFTPPNPNQPAASGSLVTSPATPQTQPTGQQVALPASADNATLAAVFSQFRDPRHPLPNRDLDTGSVVKLGGYPLTDTTYAALLHQLVRQPQQPIPPGIKADIQAFYANPPADVVNREPAPVWAQVQTDLVVLATMPTSNEPEPCPTYGDGIAASE